jgi:hypothetical protein
MLQMFHLFHTYIVEVLHVATLAGARSGRMCWRSHGRSSPYVRGKQSGHGWSRRHEVGFSRHKAHNTSVGAPPCEGGCAGVAVACGSGCVGATVACGGGYACGAGLAACMTGVMSAASGAGAGLDVRALATPFVFPPSDTKIVSVRCLILCRHAVLAAASHFNAIIVRVQ